MVDQFVTEKWIQLTTWYFDNRSNPPGNSDSTNSQDRNEIGAAPRGVPGGGCSRLELTDA